MVPAGVLYFFNWNDFGDTNPAGSYEKVFWLLAKIISPDPKGWQTATFNKDLLLLSASSRIRAAGLVLRQSEKFELSCENIFKKIALQMVWLQNMFGNALQNNHQKIYLIIFCSLFMKKDMMNKWFLRT